METQKIMNLLNDSSNGESKFTTKKWYVIESQTAKDKYSKNNSIKFETESIKSSPCDYSDEFILVTVDVTVNAGNNVNVAFKNCAPFYAYKTELNDVFIDEANHIYIAMPMYKLTEYSDNYSETPGNYDSLKEMKFQIIMLIQLMIILNYSNIKQLLWVKQKMLMVGRGL